MLWERDEWKKEVVSRYKKEKREGKVTHHEIEDWKWIYKGRRKYRWEEEGGCEKKRKEITLRVREREVWFGDGWVRSVCINRRSQWEYNIGGGKELVI